MACVGEGVGAGRARQGGDRRAQRLCWWGAGASQGRAVAEALHCRCNSSGVQGMPAGALAPWLRRHGQRAVLRRDCPILLTATGLARYLPLTQAHNMYCMYRAHARARALAGMTHPHTRTGAHGAPLCCMPPPRPPHPVPLPLVCPCVWRHPQEGLIDSIIRGKDDFTVPPDVVRRYKDAGLTDLLTPAGHVFKL